MYTSKILVLFSLGFLLLVGCQSANNETVGTLSKPVGIEFKENDVEAPEIFNAEGLAYWDGQSSLGGVWITHPNIDQATRVLIKDKYGGKSVIGAIFNRSGEDNEKRMLLSSEAAASLGVEANENRIITVTALRALKTVKSIKNKSIVYFILIILLNSFLFAKIFKSLSWISLISKFSLCPTITLFSFAFIFIT